MGVELCQPISSMVWPSYNWATNAPAAAIIMLYDFICCIGVPLPSFDCSVEIIGSTERGPRESTICLARMLVHIGDYKAYGKIYPHGDERCSISPTSRKYCSEMIICHSNWAYFNNTTWERLSQNFLAMLLPTIETVRYAVLLSARLVTLSAVLLTALLLRMCIAIFMCVCKYQLYSTSAGVSQKSDVIYIAFTEESAAALGVRLIFNP